MFRNEIAPRGGLTRQREFCQAEIEWFIKPKEYAHPKFPDVADLEITLFPAARQLDGEPPVKMTLKKALIFLGLWREKKQ